MKRLVCIDKQNNRAIKDKIDDHHDNAVMWWIDFLKLRCFVESEEKL